MPNDLMLFSRGREPLPKNGSVLSVIEWRLKGGKAPQECSEYRNLAEFAFSSDMGSESGMSSSSLYMTPDSSRQVHERMRLASYHACVE